MARSIASSRVSNVSTVTTGPNTSSLAIGIEGCTRSTIVGAMKRPLEASLSPPIRKRRAGAARGGDVALDLGQVIGADDRADLGLRIEGIADARPRFDFSASAATNSSAISR